MKNLVLFCSLFLVLSCSSVHKNVPSYSKDKISVAIDRALLQTDPNMNVGISILDLKSGAIILDKNSNRYFMPASSQKVITLAAALYYLSPSYRFKTSILTDEFNHKDMSIKNLYLKGSGDPGLMEHELINLISKLSQMGIKKITGNIHVDDQIFDESAWGKGVMWDDRDLGYAAPVCGLNLNYNQILIEYKPNFKTGEKAFLHISPHGNFAKLTNQTKTIFGSGQNNISFQVKHPDGKKEDWPSEDHQGLIAGDEIIVSGSIGMGAGVRYKKFAVKTPSIMAAHFFAFQLKNAGIGFHGNILRTKTPTNVQLLAENVSRTLSEALIDFVKISNNVATDALVKKIAEQNGFIPGDYNKGMSLIKKFLESEVGIKQNEVIAADGSGLSRYNLITPTQMVKLLEYANNKFSLGPEFMVALPIIGADGNLRHRLSFDPIKGNVRAKSGTMSGMSSLVGYTTLNGSRVAFAIMINGFVGPTAKYTQFQDHIVQILSGHSSSTFADIK